jgi:hypothetical protein
VEDASLSGCSGYPTGRHVVYETPVLLTTLCKTELSTLEASHQHNTKTLNLKGSDDCV